MFSFGDGCVDERCAITTQLPGDGDGGGDFFGMRQRDFPVGEAARICDFCGVCGEFDDGLAGGECDDFDVAPGDAAGEACAESFHDGFFAGKASGEMLCAVAATCTVGDFARCEDTVEELGWMLLEELVDAGDVFEVDAEGDGGGEGAREGGEGEVYFGGGARGW